MGETLAGLRTEAVQVMVFGLDLTGDFPMVVTTGTNRELSK